MDEILEAPPAPVRYKRINWTNKEHVAKYNIELTKLLAKTTCEQMLVGVKSEENKAIREGLLEKVLEELMTVLKTAVNQTEMELGVY